MQWIYHYNNIFIFIHLFLFIVVDELFTRFSVRRFLSIEYMSNVVVKSVSTDDRVKTIGYPVTSDIASAAGEKRFSKSEWALNFAFLSFLGFTILQFIFAAIARSDAMMADCAGKSIF